MGFHTQAKKKKDRTYNFTTQIKEYDTKRAKGTAQNKLLLLLSFKKKKKEKQFFFILSALFLKEINKQKI